VNQYQLESLKLVDRLLAELDTGEFLIKYRALEKYIGPTVPELLQNFDNVNPKRWEIGYES
jgi:hypothetical protein